MNDSKVYEFVEKAKRLIENGESFQWYMSNEGEFVIDTTQAEDIQIDLDDIRLDEMTQEELVSIKEHLKKWYDLLNNEEPDDSDYEQYEHWEDQLNEIEIFLSNIESLLEK